MSNAFPIYLLAYLLPQVILAGPLSTASLSPSVTDDVPRCARRCLESYIADNFNTFACRGRRDLDCLCTSKSTSGLTLGEAALSCLASHCPQRVLEDSVDIYELCAPIKDARPMTHGTLTVTQVVPTTIAHTTQSRTTSLPHSIGLPLHPPQSTTTNSSSHTSSSLSTRLTSTTSSPSHSVSSSFSTFLTPHTTHPTSVHSSSTTSVPPPASQASSSAGPKPQPPLTKPQIAGVTVAGVVSAALAFGVLFCIFCLWRKDKKRRNSGSSFGGDKIISSRPGSPGLPENGAADTEYGNILLVHGGTQERNGPVVENNASRWSFWRRSTKPEDIGVAVGPEDMPSTPLMAHHSCHDEAPPSATSFRTSSQLLPDKPTYSLFPQTLKVVNPSTSPISPQSPDSVETRFTDIAGARLSEKPAPRGRNALDTSQRCLQQMPKVVRPLVSDPFLHSHSEPQGLIRSENNSGIGVPWTRSLETIRKPVPARGPLGTQSSAIRSRPSLKIPSTYVGRPTYGVPDQTDVPDQSWGTDATRRNSFARPATQYSTASDATNFEDAGEEDEVQARHPVLSPVAESPRARSPSGPVRYPKIPGTIFPLNTRRPSPESPTRQPPPKNPRRALVAQAMKGKTVEIPQPQVAELYGSPVSPNMPKAHWESTQHHSMESLKGSTKSNAPSAKWQILVKPGLEGIDGSSSPREKPTPSPRSGKTGETRVSESEDWTPMVTPTKKGDELRLHVK